MIYNPKKNGKPKRYLTIDEAIEYVNAYYQHEMYKKGTIYNKISRGILKNYGKFHKALLCEDEVREKLCS